MSGSQQHKQQPLNSPVSSDSSPNLASSSTSRQERLSTSRQQRLEQLTTQLLWRLQQSSPYHEFSTSDLVLPKLPLSSQSIESVKPAKLLAGLEQSRGALYEIGVSFQFPKCRAKSAAVSPQYIHALLGYTEVQSLPDPL